MKRIFFSTILTGLLSLNAIAQPSFVKDSLDRYIDREMKRWQVPGLAIAIVKDTQVIYMKGFGFADVEAKKKVNESTLFQIASNSKAFTGTALAILESQKKLNLEDRASKWLPYFKLKEAYASRETRISDLLSHKIGFSTFQSDFLNWGCNMSRRQIIENMRTVTADYGFRERFGYCNAAFLAAGEIVPAVSDTSWDDYLKHRIFSPLKMERTSTQFQKIENDENACFPYTIYDEKLYRLARVNVDNLGPAASINSCVKDLSKWLIAQINYGKFEGKQVIPADAIYTTRQPYTLVGPGNESKKSHFTTYGLGWFMKDFQGSKVIWHDGGADGFVTTTCFVPGEKLGIVVLTNSDANSLYSTLRDQIIDAWFNLPYKNLSAENFVRNEKFTKEANDEIKSWRDSVAKKNSWKPGLKKLTGEYTNEVYGKITVKMNNNALEILFEHHPLLSATYEYMYDNTFLCTYSNPTNGIKKSEVIMAKDKVSGIVLRVNDFLDYGDYLFVKTK